MQVVRFLLGVRISLEIRTADFSQEAAIERSSIRVRISQAPSSHLLGILSGFVNYLLMFIASEI